MIIENTKEGLPLRQHLVNALWQIFDILVELRKEKLEVK